MRSRSERLRGELGSVTAELVTAIPAALAVVAVCASAVVALSVQVELESSAGHAARAAARGEAPEPYASGAAVSIDSRGGLVCVSLARPVMFGALTLEASSCADARGW